MTLRATAKKWAKRAITGSGALLLAERIGSPRAVILGYHSVVEDPQSYANVIGLGIIHSQSAFDWQMEMIARRFHPVTLEDISLFLKGQKQLPRRAVAVTFDDGFLDNYEIAAPILRRWGIPATFYVTVGCIDRGEAPWFCRLRHAISATRKLEWRDPSGPRVWKLASLEDREAALQFGFDFCSPLTGELQRATIRNIEQELDVAPLDSGGKLMMSWDHIRKLHQLGQIIGSHTMTHPNMAHVADEETVRTEFVQSRDVLEKELGAPVFHFSYPHPALRPQYTDRTVAISREAAYRTAVTTTPGPVRSGTNPLRLTRMMVPKLQDSFRWELERTFLARSEG